MSSSKTHGTTKGLSDTNVDADSNSLENQGKCQVPAPSKYIHDDLSDIVTKNPFGALSDDVFNSEFVSEEDSSKGDKRVHDVDIDSDNEVDEVIEIGKPKTDTSNRKEASTSSSEVPHV